MKLTVPLRFLGPCSISTMTAFCGSLGSISSVNVPVMTSYVPTDPKVAPLKAGWLSLIVSVVTGALAPGTPITANSCQYEAVTERTDETCRRLSIHGVPQCDGCGHHFV